MKNPNAATIPHYTVEDRGYKNTFTGRLICPRAWIEEYEKDSVEYVMF